jgi:tRNA(Arg) A34 adenosine deaminase TadA
VAAGDAEPFSHTEYFTMLLAAALRAQDAGDYGIAAALVIRNRTTELISIGRNTVLSCRDPLGHAEVNAIRGIQSLLADERTGHRLGARPRGLEVPVGSLPSTVIIRPAAPRPSPAASESVLYTTLEPCPMCAVAIISSRIGSVVVAAPDEQGGTLAQERLAKLPPAWVTLASEQGLAVHFASPDSTLIPIPAELAERLTRAFHATKEARDAEVSQGVLLQDDIADAIAGLASQQEPS